MLVHFIVMIVLKIKCLLLKKSIGKCIWKMYLKKKKEFFSSPFSFQPFGPVPLCPLFLSFLGRGPAGHSLPSLSLPLADKRGPLVSSFLPNRSLPLSRRQSRKPPPALTFPTPSPPAPRIQVERSRPSRLSSLSLRFSLALPCSRAQRTAAGDLCVQPEESSRLRRFRRVGELHLLLLRNLLDHFPGARVLPSALAALTGELRRPWSVSLRPLPGRVEGIGGFASPSSISLCIQNRKPSSVAPGRPTPATSASPAMAAPPLSPPPPADAPLSPPSLSHLCL